TAPGSRSREPDPPRIASCRLTAVCGPPSSAASQPRHLLALLEVALQEGPIGETVVGDLAVERAAVEQLIVGAAIDEPAAVEDDDLVGERDRREPVGDDERSPALERLVESAPDRGLG